MFRREITLRFVPERGIFNKTISWRIYVRGKRSSGFLSDGEYQVLLAIHENRPVKFMHDSNGNRGWMYQHECFVEDEGHTADGVKVLIDDLRLREQRKLERARVRVSSAGTSGAVRTAIPDDVKVLVWQRDAGRCVRCQRGENLEFDHIIPLTRGGSNTFRNLQLLCDDCNRAKGGNLT